MNVAGMEIGAPTAELIAAAEACGICAFGHPAPDTYRGWTISQGQWPEPAWSAIGPNYDASYEGEEDGWVSNGEAANAPTRAALIDEIDAWFEDDADTDRADARRDDAMMKEF